MYYDRDKQNDNMHRHYLNMKFTIKCRNIFSKEEEEILLKYGAWMQALVEGEIYPITSEQEDFIRVFKENKKP